MSAGNRQNARATLRASMSTGQAQPSELSAQGLRFGIVVSRFNSEITERLLAGALKFLHSRGAEDKNLSVFRVPGAFEIPLAAKKVAQTNFYDAIICIGAVIRGETLHFEIISNECARGIQESARETGIPFSFGVITAETWEQALQRSAENSGNKGSEAAAAAIEMAHLYRKMEHMKKETRSL